MTAPAVDPASVVDTRRLLADQLIAFLQTGDAPDDLFAPDAFCDLTLPQWRLQASGRSNVLALRRRRHPAPGSVPRSRFDLTTDGFLLEVEETWSEGGVDWYCRELMRADIGEEGITHFSVYCTGDWDPERRARHAAAVRLIRP